MVHELIIHKRWNRNIIFKIFNQSDAEKILSILMSLLGREVNNYWQFNAGESYTVSSGYRLLMENGSRSNKEIKDAIGPRFDEGMKQSRQMWHTLWKLNIKHKIKVFFYGSV